MRMSLPADVPGPDLSTEQIELLISTFEAEIRAAEKLLQFMITYANAGGRDLESYERILDYLARAGMKMTMAGRGAIDPALPGKAAEVISTLPTEATGRRKQVQDKISAAVLFAVWAAGEHHLIDIKSWPAELPSIVHKAVKQAPRVNNDPTLPL